MTKGYSVILLVFGVLLVSYLSDADKPCIPRQYNHDSIVCVCNSTYCDEISKLETLPSGQYVVYSSSLGGLRFHKTVNTFLEKHPEKSPNEKNFFEWLKLSFRNKNLNDATIKINRNQQYQTIFGFGGSFTDAAGLNVKTLSESTQRNFINSYFSENGLEYNVARVPIGGCDFSTHPYAYNMYPEDDLSLSNFSLTMEDFEYKMALIKEAKAVATDEILLIASAWSPPIWMKTNKKYGGESRLLPQYFQTWADYHLRFLQEYIKEDISFWAITTGNEPSNGVIPVMGFNSLGWMPELQAKWVAENLGPTIKQSEFSDIKILALDDQRFSLPWWIEWMAKNNDTMQYIDGIATHWYWSQIIPPKPIETTHQIFPDKFFISTEACVGDKPWETEKVELGSWARGEMYIKDITENLNHWFTSWIDWNLGLDKRGGPNWFDNYVDSPVIVMGEDDEFLKQPMFYAMGHFSKFIPRGSVRVEIQNIRGSVDSVALLRPDGGITVVFNNPFDGQKTVIIQEEGKGFIEVILPPRSVHSLVYW